MFSKYSHRISPLAKVLQTRSILHAYLKLVIDAGGLSALKVFRNRSASGFEYLYHYLLGNERADQGANSIAFALLSMDDTMEVNIGRKVVKKISEANLQYYHAIHTSSVNRHLVPLLYPTNIGKIQIIL